MEGREDCGFVGRLNGRLGMLSWAELHARPQSGLNPKDSLNQRGWSQLLILVAGDVIIKLLF